MTDKERLEDIILEHGQRPHLRKHSIEWLIGQAEKVEELTKDAEHLAEAWTDKVEENKKLRKALETIKSTSMYPLNQSWGYVYGIARKTLEEQP